MHIKVLSRTNFFEFLKQNNINEKNVESINDTAFISILNTTDKDYKEWYDKVEWDIIPFEKNHSNVLVLEFDDVSYPTETIIDDGVLNGTYTFKPINRNQSQAIINFVEKNLNKKNIIIHCTAGISRSGAVGMFISDYYNNKEDKEWFERNNSHIRPNHKVFTLLKSTYNELTYDYPI